MEPRVVAAKKVFVVTTVLCAIFGGIPLLLWSIRIASGFFIGTQYQIEDYTKYKLYGHVLWAIALGLATVVPPVITYLRLIERRASAVRATQENKAEPERDVEVIVERPVSGQSNSGQIIGRTLVTAIGIAFAGVLYAEIMKQRSPGIGVLDGLSIAASWAALIGGIVFAVKLHNWKEGLWGLAGFLIGILPIVGPMSTTGFFAWEYFKLAKGNNKEANEAWQRKEKSIFDQSQNQVPNSFGLTRTDKIVLVLALPFVIAFLILVSIMQR